MNVSAKPGNILSLILFMAAGAIRAQEDVEILKARIVEYRTLLVGTTPDQPVAGESGVTELLNSQQSDGSWEDLDYTDTSTGQTWEPRDPLIRMGESDDPRFESARIYSASP